MVACSDTPHRDVLTACVCVHTIQMHTQCSYITCTGTYALNLCAHLHDHTDADAYIMQQHHIYTKNWPRGVIFEGCYTVKNAVVIAH